MVLKASRTIPVARDITKNSSREAPREQIGELRMVKYPNRDQREVKGAPRAIQMVLKACRTIPVGHQLEVEGPTDNKGGPIYKILMPLRNRITG